MSPFRPEKSIFAVVCVLVAVSAVMSGSIYQAWAQLFSVGVLVCFFLSFSAGPERALFSLWPAWLLVGLMFLSALWSVNLNLTLDQAFFFTVFALFSFIAAYSSGEGRAAAAIRLIAFTSAGVSVYGIYQYAAGFAKTEDYLMAYGVSEFGLSDEMLGRALHALGYRRAFSTLLSPNVLACYLATSFPALMALARGPGRPAYRAAYAVAMAAVLAALVFTKSIGGLAAFAVGGSVYVLASSWPFGRAGIKKAAAVLTFLAVVSASAGYFVISERSGGFWGFERSYSERLSYFKGALDAFSDAPLMGNGAGSFSLTYLRTITPGSGESRYAHNVFLQVMSETGLLGLAVLAVLFGVFVTRCTGGMRRDPSNILYPAALAGGAAFLAHNMVDFTFYVHETAVLFWLYFGLVSAGAEDGAAGRSGRYARAVKSVAVAAVLVFTLFYGKSVMASWRHADAMRALEANGLTSASMVRSNPVPDEAVAYAEESSRLKPYDDGYRSFLANIYEGAAYAGGPEYARKAEGQYLEAVDLNPLYPFHHRDLGVLYLKMGRNDEAIKQFEEAVRLYPASKELAKLLAESQS